MLEFVDELAAEDQVFESHGVKVIIDPKSLVYLDGTELDFTREGLNEGFKFNNPNVWRMRLRRKLQRLRPAWVNPVISPSSTCNRLSWSISTSSARRWNRRGAPSPRSVHPDRFAAASPAERRVAMQWAARANEAYQTQLRDPLLRARYLCEQAGVAITSCMPLESNTSMDPAFLLQQMQLARNDGRRAQRRRRAGRAADRAGGCPAADACRVDAACWDDAQRREEAERLVRRMQFLDKLAQEVRPGRAHSTIPSPQDGPAAGRPDFAAY